jgi:hypothetical protein
MLRLCQKHTESNPQRRQSQGAELLAYSTTFLTEEKSYYFSGLMNVELFEAVFLSVVLRHFCIRVHVF